MTISQQATDVRNRARQGLVGMPTVSSHLISFLTLINEDPQTVEVRTVTVDSAADDTDYTITINGVDVTIDSGTGATTASIALALAAAVEAEPAVRGQVTADGSGDPDVVLTGLTAGLAFTATVGANLSVVLTTAAASAAAIPFGRLVVDDGAHPDGDATRLGKLAAATAYTAQTATLTVTFAAASHYSVTITDEATGRVIADVGVPADTTNNTTAANLDAALNAALPANTVLSSVATNVVTLTAEVAGFEFSVTASEAGAGAGTIVLADTNGPSTATSLARTATGISMHSIMDEAAAIGDLVGEYPANAGFRALQKGPIWVDRDTSTTVSKGDAVFVELGAGDDTGKFFASGSATRVELGALTWERDGRTSADGLAAIRAAL